MTLLQQSPGPVTDRRAFDAQVARSYSHVYHSAYKLLGNAADAEDVTQDAFLRAWRHSDRLEPGLGFRRWTMRVAHNLSIDRYRQRTRMRTVSLEAIGGGEGETEALSSVAAPDPAVIVQSSQVHGQILRIMNSLPEPYRTVEEMVDVKQMGYHQIAEELNLPMTTVRSRIHRARSMMRKRLVAVDIYPSRLTTHLDGIRIKQHSVRDPEGATAGGGNA